MREPDLDTPVLIVGGGPVGLALACELGWRGVSCVLVEEDDGVNIHPRANVLQVRVQELFRRWGITGEVRDAGYPEGYPCDFVFTSRVTRHEIFRFSFPDHHSAINADEALLAKFPEIAHSPGYKLFVGQNELEPILARRAATFPEVTLMTRCRLTGFSQDEGGVAADVVGLDGKRRIRASYMVGCDGGRSTVRAQLGLTLEGLAEFGSNLGIYFRAPDFYPSQDKGLCALYWSMAPGASGVFIPIDGREHFNLQRHLRPDERVEEIDAQKAIETSFGMKLKAEIKSVQPWSSHALVSPKYRAGRVFLAGDAAHLFVPTGGFGMNTGIVDAIDLGTRLAGALQGWMGPAMLDAYDAERRLTAIRTAREAADNHFEITPCLLAPHTIERDDEVGDIVRGKYATMISRQRKHFNAFGINLGYRYISPVIATEGNPPPPGDAETYIPSTYPGMRAPHVWLGKGLSTLDLFGTGFTLLCFGAEPPDRIGNEAVRLGIRLDMHRIDHPKAIDIYQKAFVLVRPDGTVCWRGDNAAGLERGLLARFAGFAPECAAAQVYA